MNQSTNDGDVEAVYVKIAKRLMPLLVLLYVMAWLDRVNVGFAKLQMVKDLGFSEAVYGFGAGIFFLGYVLFEIPSNLFLERTGARKTIARITVLWGIASIGTMFVKTAAWFYILRFLLGAFEAGLYPGVVLYLTYWFPARRRAQMLGLFMTAIPAAGALGSVLSGWIMSSTSGRGHLANWQWLFLIEGIPSIIVGLTTLAIFDDKPAQARWLTEGERQLVLADLAEDDQKAGPRQHRFAQALRIPRVWLLTLIYFCLVSANPTLGFWAPTIISDLGVKNNMTIGLLSAVPYIVGVIATVLVGRHSDRTLERRYHAALSCLVAAVGLVLIGVFANVPALAFAALVLGVTGVLCAFAPFWQMPTTLLAGSAAAGGIALINSIGNLSGWLGPYLVGWLKDVTGKTAAGLYAVAGLEALATVLILLLVPRRKAGESGN
ncbi:MAG TPA: MFS transporter [Candidatus Saccharimonadales bacterium]|jgi:D-galactonate transporter|nr:MFS transporter [Candidatus Saccharimonadales bacterium]